MAFLNKIGKAIGDAAGTATEKAKDFAETTKLNNAISGEEKQINQYFLEIGKYVFEQERNNPESPVAEACGKIIASLRNIEELKRKIAEIKLDNNNQ
jgi:Na+/phosphate symporter